MKEYLRKRSADMDDKTEYLFELAMKENKLPKAITWQEVMDYNKGITWLCNDHVFRTYRARGLMNELDYDNFFKTVYGDRRREIPELHKKLPLAELLDLIKRAGGILASRGICGNN